MGEKAKFLLPKGFDTPMAAPVTAAAAAAAAAARSAEEEDLEALVNAPNPSESDDDFLGEHAVDADHDC